MRAIQLQAFGNPVEVLKFVEVPEPPPPGPGQVLVGIEYAPLNLSDLLVARGVYAYRPPLPAFIGNEGVGRVLQVGEGVTNVAVGARVVPPLASFTFRERLVVPAAGLFALPDADPKQLAMLTVNPPTAAILLDAFVRLAPGAWVLQNAANSGVGRWVIALAKKRGLRTVNVVRSAGLVPELTAQGADAVVVDGPDLPKRIREAVSAEPVLLAIDGVGGASTAALSGALSAYGTLLVYAAMAQAPTTVSPLDLIFKPLTVRGFFLGHPEHQDRVAPAVKEAAALLASGAPGVPVAATYPLSRIADAVVHVQRGGKVLLEVGGAPA